MAKKPRSLAIDNASMINKKLPAHTRSTVSHAGPLSNRKGRSSDRPADADFRTSELDWRRGTTISLHRNIVKRPDAGIGRALAKTTLDSQKLVVLGRSIGPARSPGLDFWQAFRLFQGQAVHSG
jgi:hypothetical protein